MKVSVIIPARNEEKNLPHLLASLARQTAVPYEILVVDDFSSDRTAEIAREFGVTLIANPPLPEGWTGKNWAVWNGYLHAAGDLFVFLDSDIRLAPDGLVALIENRAETGGAISVLPYHYMEGFIERLSLVPFILGVFAFFARSEKNKEVKPLYGSCIAVTREDYERISGHQAVRSELLDDMSLGMAFSRQKIPVKNFLGNHCVKFRMYPGGIRHELEGFSKGAVSGMNTLRKTTVLSIAGWMAGLLLSGFGLPVTLLLHNLPWILTFAAGYLMYAAMFYYVCAPTGRYGILMPLLHFLSSAFFICVMLYASYRTTVHKTVVWKGRLVSVVQDSASRFKKK